MFLETIENPYFIEKRHARPSKIEERERKVSLRCTRWNQLPRRL
jgi:hypothetical protein